MKLTTATLLVPLLAVPVRQLAAPPRAPSQQSAAYTYRGTIHAVRPAPGIVDLITGVGEAIRTVHMSVLPTTRIETTGGKLTLADLKPGDVVQAECRVTDKGLVADKIQKLTFEGPRGAAAP